MACFGVGCLTSLLSVGWHDPLVGLLQGAVTRELQPSVGEDGNQSRGQAFVEDQGALSLVHSHHSVSQGLVDLDTHVQLE
jgi:hypothetical protein